jgi:hypothetical protein
VTLPGWSSLDSVIRIHDILEISGFVLLGILAVVEGFQFVYGHRKDTLTAQIQQAEAKVAENQIEALQARQAGRTLSDQQKQSLIAALSPHRGQKVSVARIMGDGEAEPFANNFLDVFVASGWVFNGSRKFSKASTVKTLSVSKLR